MFRDHATSCEHIGLRGAGPAQSIRTGGGPRSGVGRVVMKLFARFAKCESGATSIEYGLIVSLIGIFIVASVNSVGVGVGNTFDRVETAL